MNYVVSVGGRGVKNLQFYILSEKTAKRGEGVIETT